MQSERDEIYHLTANCQYPINNNAVTYNISGYISLIAKVKLTTLTHEGNFSRKKCMLLPYFMLVSQIIKIIFQYHNSYKLHSRSEKKCKISSQLKHATLPFMGHKLDHLAISGQPAQEGLQPYQCIPERNINQHNFLGTTKSIKMQ